MREMVLFAVIRLVLWAGIWWVLTQFDIGTMLAGVLAALIAMLISILFLNRVRDAAAMRWKAADERRRERHADDVDEDAEAEDAILDSDDAAGDAAHRVDTGAAENADVVEQADEPDEPDELDEVPGTPETPRTGPSALPDLPAAEPATPPAEGR